MEIMIETSTTWATDAQCQKIGEALGDQFYPACRARGNEYEPRTHEAKAAINKAIATIDVTAVAAIGENEIKSQIRYYMRQRILDRLEADGVDVPASHRW